MRVTRAASRVEHAQHADGDIETNDASITRTDVQDRVPLGHVSANNVLDPDSTDAPAKKMAVKKGKAKGTAQKGAKGKKAKAAQDEEKDGPLVPDDGRQAAGSPASDAAVDELAGQPIEDTAQAPVGEEQPASSPSRAVRMTRRQLAKQEEDFSRSLRSSGPLQSEAVEVDTTATAQEPSPSEVQEKRAEKLVTEEATRRSYAEIVPESAEEPAEEPRAASDLKASQDLMEEFSQAQEQENIDDQEGTVGPQVEVVPDTVETEVEEPAGTIADDPEQEVTTPSLEVTEPEPKVLTSQKPLEDAVTPTTSVTPSRAISRSSTRSASRTPMRLEESIGAIDDLEEALENVGRSLPSFDQLADDKSPRKAKFTRTATPGKSPRQTAQRTIMRPKDSKSPSLTARSLKPTGLSRASSVRAPPKERTGSEGATDYLASRRRPIIMTFAPPPPPAKSTKAPTTSEFQLPGERIAAELKARKEERLKRMAEAGAPRPRLISMPPPPKSTKPPTKSDFRLPGESIAAELKAKKEERLRRMAEGEATTSRQINLPPPPKSSKPPTVPKFQLPGEKFAAEQKARKEERLKHEAEEAGAATKAAFKARPAPVRRSVIAPVRQTAASQARERLMSKENISDPTVQHLQRSGSVTANKSSSIVQARLVSTSPSKRNSVKINPDSAKLGPAGAAAPQKNRGREVFNRDKLEKDARDNERRVKEESAKKARAEAAERGRIASREWARKQMEKRQEAARRTREAAA
ncbi:uncharacterized protein N0V89_002546 [Didymosphaeria variabile]|uniref:Carboxylesterase family protein n=1 Tax=Didymosphaeria variabile TaxID=1932322 RepID=A0A9W9CEM2_9PLEO|nr:uncharacterized protein N0V89_002546 [Didymosphaeria variabile]KAJ4357969.1 hypothetical protein N0V89_002546 [Didymosphaeria variabile]